MKASDILKGVEVIKSTCGDADITGIENDSRKVTPGAVFAAFGGLDSPRHGIDYAAGALSAGAVAVLTDLEPAGDIPYILVPDARRAAAVMAANLRGNPARELKIIGVTGTKGKTTTTHLIKEIIEKTTGEKAGLIGTNHYLIGDEELPSSGTTPEAAELHELFRSMADAGCRYVVMEVSSHSLALGRVHGLAFAAGVFTNLSLDHLNFHKTMDDYAAAKSELMAQSLVSVVNLDDERATDMLARATGDKLTYSASNDMADIVAKNIRMRSDSVEFEVITTGHIARVRLGMPGMFSVYNSLAALSACVAVGIPLEDAAAVLKDAGRVKGRVEVVPTDTDYTVIIDYAHTPDSLESVLKSLKEFAKGRIITLFGCGGDRDRTKRPIMGGIAARLSDYCVVTSDNPRTEDPMAIIREITVGMEKSSTPMAVIENRREAIFHALGQAKAGDVVLLAGKGQETYQEIAGVKRHFDEREIIADYFASK